MQENLQSNPKDNIASKTVREKMSDIETELHDKTNNTSINEVENNTSYIASATHRIQSFAVKYYPKCKELVISALSYCKVNLQKIANKLETYSTQRNGNPAFNSVENNTRNATNHTVPHDSSDGAENNISYIVEEVPYTFPNNRQSSISYGSANNMSNMQYNATGYPPNNASNMQNDAANAVQNVQYGTQRHDVPKCTCCGYVGQWEIEPLIRPMDWVIGIAFTFLACGSGLVYLGVVAAIRSNKDNRAKICPACKARNLFTFIY